MTAASTKCCLSALAAAVVVLELAAPAHGLVAAEVPVSLSPSGTMTLADGSTRSFTSAQAASIRKTLVGQASLYGQTAPPSGSYVLDQGTRAKILAGNGVEAPATRRGMLSIAERTGLRRAMSAFGPVSILATANLAVWSVNAGYVEELLGWGDGATPLPAVVASLTYTPVRKGEEPVGGLNSSVLTPSRGYRIGAQDSAGAWIYGAAEQAYTNTANESECGGVSQGPTLSGVGIPQETASNATNYNCTKGPQAWSGYNRKGTSQIGFARGDPKPREGSPPAGARVGVSPSPPAAKTEGEMDADTNAVLAGPLNTDEGRALLEAVSESGNASSSPMSDKVEVPSCAGDLFATCYGKMTGAGLKTDRVVLAFAEADLDQPANYVTTVEPAAPAQVDSGSTVKVTTNPPPESMPLRLPAPAASETYAQYLARLQALGFVGTATRVQLSDTTLDPAHGPSEVTSTSPGSGTRVAPDGNVTVRVNPETAPEVAGSGGGGTGNPSIHAVNFAPLNVASLCDNFPFGVPCWLYDVMKSWVVGTPSAPSWTIPFPFVSSDKYPTIDLELWDEWAPPLRAFILLVAAVGISLKFYALATGQSRGGDGD